ncbi:flagellar hook-length control protein FliK [Aliikangiella sp. IMCC44653]
MRISNNDAQINQLAAKQLDPRVLALINEIQNKPILVKQLLLAEQQPLSLTLTGNARLAQLLLPMELTQAIANITKQSFQAQLSATKSAVLLELSGVNSKATTSNKLIAPIQLTFSSAKLLNNNTLSLNNLLSPNTSQLAPLTSSTAATPNSPKNTHAASSQANPLISLKAAINLLLSPQSKPTQNLSSNLNRLNNLSQQLNNLITSSQTLVLTNPEKPRSQPLQQSLNSAAVKELMQLIPAPQNQTKALNKALQVTLQTEKLIAPLDFSKNNSDLKLAQRLNNSGLFFEQKLAQLERQVNSDNSPTFTGNSKASKQTALNLTNHTIKKDFKLNQLQLKQLIESAIQLLGKANNTQIDPAKMTLSVIQAVSQHLQASKTASTQLPPAIIDKLHTASSNPEEQPKIFRSPELNQLVSQLMKGAALVGVNQSAQKQLGTAVYTQILNDMLLEVNASITKTESNQLLSLRSELPLLQQYLFDLPIHNNGKVTSFELLLESQKQSKQDKQSRQWTISIKFDLEPLGPMLAKVIYQNKRISTHFSAENESTAALLKAHMQQLKDSLFIAGVDVDEIKSKQSKVEPLNVDENTSGVDIQV